MNGIPATNPNFYIGSMTLEVEHPGHPGKACCVECKMKIPADKPRLLRAENKKGFGEWKRYWCADCGIQYIRELVHKLNNLSAMLWSLSQ